MTKKLARIPKLQLFLWALLLGIAFGQLRSTARADQPSQEIMGASGDLFMEEEAPKTSRKRATSAQANIINGDGTKTADSNRRLQSVQDNHNGIFMEEVDSPPKSKSRRAYVDLSNVGIQVDPSGNMVPLIDHSGTPVRPLFSNTQAYHEMPVPTINQTMDNPLGLPYTMTGQPAAVGTSFQPVTPSMVPFMQPSVNPFNGVTTFNPYSASPWPGSGRAWTYSGPNPSYWGYPGGYAGRGLNFSYNPGIGYWPQSPSGASQWLPYGRTGNSISGNALVLPWPTQTTYSSRFSGSNLVTPFLRDPKTSTGDLLEDVRKSGLWSNSAGTSQANINRGLIGGSFNGSSEGHDTGVTSGPNYSH